MFGFIKHIGHALGSVAHVAIAPVKFTVGGVGSIASHIPVVGKPFHAALDSTLTGPLAAADAVSKGARIDHAVMKGVKIQLKGYKDLAPYAKLVVHQIPGIGLGAEAAVAAGSALAQGKRIDKAVVEGVSQMVPGPLKADFEKGFSMAQSALPLAQMNAELSKLTPQAKKTFQSAMALGHGARLQGALAKAAASPGTMLNLKSAATAKLVTDPILSAGDLVLTDKAVNHGYHMAIGTFSHDVQPIALDAIRKTLSVPELQGFNIGMAVHIGMAHNKAPVGMSPREQFGYYAVYGMIKANGNEKSAMLATVSHDNSARVGVNRAIGELKTKGLWPRIKAYVSKHVHIHHKAA